MKIYSEVKTRELETHQPRDNSDVFFNFVLQVRSTWTRFGPRGPRFWTKGWLNTEMSHEKRLRISIEDKTSSDLTPYFKSVAIFIHKGKVISFLKRGASSQRSFGPHSAWGSKESTTILTTHPSLSVWVKLCESYYSLSHDTCDLFWFPVLVELILQKNKQNQLVGGNPNVSHFPWVRRIFV